MLKDEFLVQLQLLYRFLSTIIWCILHSLMMTVSCLGPKESTNHNISTTVLHSYEVILLKYCLKITTVTKLSLNDLSSAHCSLENGNHALFHEKLRLFLTTSLMRVEFVQSIADACILTPTAANYLNLQWHFKGFCWHLLASNWALGLDMLAWAVLDKIAVWNLIHY